MASGGKQRIAIIGSGVSGLGALYALRDSGHEVHMYEEQGRLGGHTNTRTWKHGNKQIDVDTGFIVMNTATYPNFIPFLKEVGVKTVPTAMTFGVTRDQGAFEWSGTSLGSVFAQRENIYSLRFWRMIFDIIRFNQFALDLLSETDGTMENDNDESIGDYLERQGYSEAFRDDYLIPMTACVWSTGADKCALEFPAVTLIRFMWNHHLLSTVAARPDWLTIPNGSKQYIKAVLDRFPDAKVHLSSPAVGVIGAGPDGKVRIVFDGGVVEEFDQVLLACHGDQAMQLVEPSTPQEREVLGAFETTPNVVYLHSDLSLMPKRRVTWSAWNYLTSSKPRSKQPSNKTIANTSTASGNLDTVALTYNMNILQHIDPSEYNDILVTMNPPHTPDPAKTQAKINYRHPLYNAKMVRAQSRLPEIQGTKGIWYAGAWTGYGFHEDGFSSGIDVGIKLGGSVPWKKVDAKFIRGRRPSRTARDNLARIIILFVHIWIMLLQRVPRLPRLKMPNPRIDVRVEYKGKQRESKKLL